MEGEEKAKKCRGNGETRKGDCLQVRIVGLSERLPEVRSKGY